MTRHGFLVARLGLLVLAAGVWPGEHALAQGTAQETVQAGATVQPVIATTPNPAVGPVTKLPLPRFVSIKSDTVYARRGPSKSHRIDWIYRQPALPVQVVAEHGHWRRIRDRDGEGGWVHYALLSGTRTVIIDHDMLELHSRPMSGAPVIAQLEAGVIARLDDCTPDWCRVIADGYRGWAPKTALWGVQPDEIRD